MPGASEDQNLLFGALAFQLGFVDREQFVAAMNTWLLAKSRPLGDVLTEMGALTSTRAQLVRNLVQEHLEAHDNDVQRSLSALDSAGSVRDALKKIESDGYQPTLSVSGTGGKSSSDATETFTIDKAVVAGQRFRILRPHAEGGLGKVSVALDEELHREVALKELKGFHADNLHSRARFMLEAEINGGLEHPGIVPIYGLGKYADGRPYYVMRFIRGITLSDAIDRFHQAMKQGCTPGERSLEFRRLLRHFVDICQVVQYAHCRGVLHRDLKPSNVMLGKYGETLVVDWGLAKAEGSRPASDENEEQALVPLSGSSSVPTVMGQTLGTPAYMSPEQAEGKWDQVGPTSDVYSLGATLYHLLVGRAAFGGKNTTEVLKKVREGEFENPRDANSAVPKPLEAVCLKAMSLSQRNRYKHAANLAEDIDHWLADEPVSAYKDSTLERGFRWLRHHRSWALAGGLALLVVVVVSVVASLLINAARQRAVVARQEAVERFHQARLAVDNWLTGTSDILQYYPDVGSIRAKLLEQAAKDYETFVRGEVHDVELQIEQGRTWLRLGDVRNKLRDTAAAQEAYTKAVTILEDLATRNPDSQKIHLECARALIKAGSSHREAGHSNEAEKMFEAALAALRQGAPAQSAEPQVHELTGIALTNQALCFIDTESRGRAESLLRQAIDELDVARAATESDSEAAQAWATACHLLGGVLADLGQYAAASRQIRHSVAAYDELVEADPRNVLGRADARTSLANLLRVQGRWFEELQCRQETIDDLKLLDSTLPDSPVLVERIALAQVNHAQLLNLLSRPAKAEQELNETIQLLAKLLENYLTRAASPRDIPLNYWVVRRLRRRTR